MVSSGVSRATHNTTSPSPKYRVCFRCASVTLPASHACPRNRTTRPAYTVTSTGQPITSSPYPPRPWQGDQEDQQHQDVGCRAPDTDRTELDDLDVDQKQHRDQAERRPPELRRRQPCAAGEPPRRE